MRSKVVHLFAAAGAVLVVTLLMGPAGANPFGPTIDGGCPNWCYNENNHPRFWYDASLGTAWVTAAEDARVNELNPTDINSTRVSSHDNSDVAVYVNDYGDTGWYGISDCISWSGNVCKHWHERFNTYLITYTANQKKSLACHEFGHTTGLDHWFVHQSDPTCMENPDWHLHYNAHDKSHVNGYY